ncbi:MAG: choice-of-anchor Q domain-containing protein [Luteolibacter sp.]
MKRSLPPAIAAIFLFSPACLLGGGLTDGFGYSGTTSEEGGPVYAFKDISSTGTAMTLTSGSSDDGAATVTLTTPFAFYGMTYTQLQFSTNGYLSTDPEDPGTDFENDASLPFTTSGGARIYALHDDLTMSNGLLHYQYFPEGIESPMFTGGFPFRPRIGVSVFQWTDARHIGNFDDFFSFQALLFDDGSIYFTYDGGNPETGSGSTTGMHNEDASIGLLVAADTAGSIPGNFAVSITPPHSIVTTTADNGPGSLRQAIADSPSPGLITFDPTVFNKEDEKTILLTSGQLIVSGKNLAIEGNDVCGVTLDAGENSRVFFTTANSTLVLDSLNITGGISNDGSGGAGIYNLSSTTVLNCAIYANDSRPNSGGGVRNFGNCRIANSTVYGNSAHRGAGIECQPNSTLVLRNSTISGNSATSETSTAASGGLESLGSVTLSNCVIAGNSADINPELSNFISTLSEGGNFIRDNSGATGSFPSNGSSANGNGDYVGTAAAPLEPMFAGDSGGDGTALINNGGPTLTLMPLPGSPLIDKGIASTLPDQRGVLPVGIARDIGAVETTWDDAVTVGTPAEFDVTTPGDPVAIFPLNSVLPFAEGPDRAIDNINSDGFTHDDTFNAGLSVTPLLASAQITGFTLTSATFDRTEDPTCFLLLGSDDGNRFSPIASASLAVFPGGHTDQSFQFTIPSRGYRHYRVIFPQNSGNSLYTTIEEIVLHGTLVEPPGDTPRIVDFKVTPNSVNSANNDVSITFISQQGFSYGIQAGTMLNDFTNINGTIPTPGEYTTTTVSTYQAVPKAFFRVFSLPTE